MKATDAKKMIDNAPQKWPLLPDRKTASEIGLGKAFIEHLCWTFSKH